MPTTQLWIPLTTSIYFENKDKTLIPTNRPLQPANEKYEGGQREEETDFEEFCDLEIVEQSALDHFNTVLQKAQRIVAKAEKEKPPKRPKRYEGKSKRTLKWCKKCQEDLAKQGYLFVFEFMDHVRENAKKRAHTEQLAARALECKQESEESMLEESEESTPEELEESMPEELDIKDLMSKHVGQHQQNSWNSWSYFMLLDGSWVTFQVPSSTLSSDWQNLPKFVLGTSWIHFETYCVIL